MILEVDKNLRTISFNTKFTLLNIVHKNYCTILSRARRLRILRANCAICAAF